MRHGDAGVGYPVAGVLPAALAGTGATVAVIVTPKHAKLKHAMLSQAKAREMLHDGTVHGKALTKKQRGYFGLIASGKKPTR